MTRVWSRAGKRNLGDIIAVADNWGDIETFGTPKLEWFETFLELSKGIPLHDAFGRVFSLVDAQRFQDTFIE